MQLRDGPYPGLVKNWPYSAGMGRTLRSPRPAQGARLVELRLRAGLSQVALAKILNVSQQTVAYWEQSSRPPPSDVLPKVARALGVSAEDLLDLSREASRALPPGPPSTVRKLFEKVSRLPRRQQQRVAEVVQALLEQYERAG